VTIHGEHPFLPAESDRDPVRRLRGRVGGAVSLWTTGSEPEARSGLTVSSFMVAVGEPAHLVALVDPESDFAAAVTRTRVAVVHLLEWGHQQLAEAFAGQFPAPGGPFRMGDWTDTGWGPRLVGVSTWCGVRLIEEPVGSVGWSTLLDVLVEHLEIGVEQDPLIHRRGRYLRPQA
jgi:flavin reductase (DIM6/NTAB) family NADH-FMN oxidoreductase RutF